MNTAPPRFSAICPECGATHPAKATSCWLCGGTLALVEIAQLVTPPPTAQQRADSQLGQSIPMLTITSAAVVLGATLYSPGLGIALAISITPALLRALLVAIKIRTTGRPAPVGPLAVFGITLAITVTVLGMAGIVALAVMVVMIVRAMRDGCFLGGGPV